jgi:hypothetical protein
LFHGQARPELVGRTKLSGRRDEKKSPDGNVYADRGAAAASVSSGLLRSPS